MCVCVREKREKVQILCVVPPLCVWGFGSSEEREREREAPALIETNKDEVMVAVTQPL